MFENDHENGVQFLDHLLDVLNIRFDIRPVHVSSIGG